MKVGKIALFECRCPKNVQAKKTNREQANEATSRLDPNDVD